MKAWNLTFQKTHVAGRKSGGIFLYKRFSHNVPNFFKISFLLTFSLIYVNFEQSFTETDIKCKWNINWKHISDSFICFHIPYLWYFIKKTYISVKMAAKMTAKIYECL